jgi:uncharacterized protein (DUF58 family)
VGTVVALVAFAAVAHNSGSGWVQAMGSLLAGFAVAGLGGPGLACGRLRLSVVTNPTDATAGQPLEIEVATNAPARIEAVTPHGHTTTIGASTGRVQLVPARRGPLLWVTLEVASAAPFGLLWWHKRVVVPLARPLWVAPVPGPPDAAMLTHSATPADLDRHRPRDARVGEPRGVRPYMAGDPQRLVHWPATAHRGELMVREAERPEAAVPEVRVILPDDGPEGDAVAGRGLGTVVALLTRSSPVMLATTERDGPRHEAVYTRADAARRLARAVSPGAVSPGAARPATNPEHR